MSPGICLHIKQHGAIEIEERQSRSAELNSAVSQNCILRSVQIINRANGLGVLAECNSAIQQIKNLRYDFLATLASNRTRLRQWT